MKETIKERYRRELEEMDNDEILFEYRFCSLSIEKLQRRVKNSEYDLTLLECERVRFKMCETEILKRMERN